MNPLFDEFMASALGSTLSTIMAARAVHAQLEIFYDLEHHGLEGLLDLASTHDAEV